MKYILYDVEDYSILGLNIEQNADKLTDEWTTLADDAYKTILNGVNYRLIKEKVQERLELYENTPEDEKKDFIFVTLDCITNEIEVKLEEVIEKQCDKAKEYCKMFIEDGVIYTLSSGQERHYTYKYEDQINLDQIKQFVDKGFMTVVPLKGSGEMEHDELSTEEFNNIYKRLIYNKYYHIYFLEELVRYINTLTDINEIQRMQYETELPKEYMQRIEEKISLLNLFNK